MNPSIKKVPSCGGPSRTVRSAILLTSLAATACLPTTSWASTLYGISSTTPGHLYTLDPATGAATFVTDVTGADLVSFSGLESLNGVLYATDVAKGEWKFGTVDKTTGAFTAINNQDGSANWHGLAADHDLGLFYTVDLNDGNKLKSVTPSGTVTTIGPAGIEMRGMAFDDVNNILYGVDAASLYTLNTATGAATLIGATGAATDWYEGLDYDNATKQLFYNTAGNLYTLNTVSAAATLVGLNGVDRIDGLAHIDVPDVSQTSVLLLMGLGGLWLARERLSSLKRV